MRTIVGGRVDVCETPSGFHYKINENYRPGNLDIGDLYPSDGKWILILDTRYKVSQTWSFDTPGDVEKWMEELCRYNMGGGLF